MCLLCFKADSFLLSIENNKSRTSEKISKKSGLVPSGLDLSNLIDDFQTLRILMNSRNWKSVF